MKTEPNESITPCHLRQTGENSFKLASERDMKEGMYLSSSIGLNKREWMASNIRLDMEGWRQETAEKMLGKNMPTEPLIDNIKFWAEFDAFLKVLHADALINELNKTEK